MMIIFLILSLTLINIKAEENDSKFIETLPPEVKKAFLDKVSRRILEEVPEVDTGAGATNGEVIDAKLEEQSEFVQKILREEIDSLKARRKNDDDKLDIPETGNKTVKRSGDKVEHIDLTLRTHSKRSADQVNKTKVDKIDIVDKKEVSEANIKSKDKVETDTKNEHGENKFQTEHNPKEFASKQDNNKVNIPNNVKAVLKNTVDMVSSPNLESKIINIVPVPEKTKILQDEGIQVASKNSNEINSHSDKKVLSPSSDQSDTINWIKNDKKEDIPKTESTKQIEHEDVTFLTPNSDKTEQFNEKKIASSKILEKEDINDPRNEDVSKKKPTIPHIETRNEENKVSSLNVDENKNDLKIENMDILTKEDVKELLSIQNINDEKTESTKILNKYAKTNPPRVDENKKYLKIENSDILTKEDVKDLLSSQNINGGKTESSKMLENKYVETTAPHADHNKKNPDIREFETIVKFRNEDEMKPIKSATIKDPPDTNINLTKIRTENIKSDGEKHENKKLEEDNKAPKVLNERKTPNNSDKSNEYLEDNQPTNLPKEVSNKDIVLKIEKTNTHEELKLKKVLRNADMIPNDLPFATTVTPHQATNVLKSTNPKITSFNVESDKKLTIKTVEKNTVDIKNNTEIKKPCNKTEDCDKKSTITIETTTDIPKKIKLNVLRSLDTNTGQGSAEHFGNLRPVKEYKVYEIDEKKSAFMEISTTENVEQPHYFPVYNYEPRNAYYNGENRLGPNVLGSVKKDLRENVQKHGKGSSEHFGDLQIMKGHQVFESDPSASPFDEEKSNENAEQPRYYPVYNYEPQNVHFHAYNRLGPNEDDNDINDGNERQNDYFKYNIDQDTAEVESIVFESGKLNDKRSVRNIKGYVERKELNPKRFKYISFEEEQPYQVVKKGLKSNLEAARHILEGIEKFDNAISNEDIEEAFILRKDTKNTVWENSYETDREYDTNENISNDEDDDKNDGKEQGLLNALIELRREKKKKKKLDVQWYPEENKVQIDGVMYDLDDLKVEGQKVGKIITNQMEASRLPVYAFADAEKISDKSKERLKGIGDEVYDQTIKHVMGLNNMRPGILNLTDKGKILDTLNKLKKGIINLESNKTAKQEKYPKEWMEWDPKKNYKNYPMHKMLRFQVESNSNRATNIHDTDSESAEEPIKLNTIDEIIHITPEVDMITNLEELINNKVPIMRSNDEDLEMYVTILKDLVKAGNPGLESYDWLGTTVDIQAALTKLIDLVNRRKTLTYIHPSDLQLLKYVEAIYRNARTILLDKEKYLLPQTPSERVNDILNKKLPKSKKTHINAFKVINKLYKLRTADSLEEFLVEMKNGLEDFHSLLKVISKITKFRNQRWYKNIKELYLVNAERKEYLEVLLHLFATRFFGLLEDSLKKGAEDNFKDYIKRNRAEVDRTEVEVMFILRILKAIKELN